MYANKIDDRHEDDNLLQKIHVADPKLSGQGRHFGPSPRTAFQLRTPLIMCAIANREAVLRNLHFINHQVVIFHAIVCGYFCIF